MKTKNSFFFKDFVGGFLFGMLILVIDIILMIVFWNFEQYVAMVFLGVAIPIILLSSFSFVIVTENSVKVFSFGKISAVIPFDELQMIDSHAGHPDTMTFLGTGDMFSCKYNDRVIVRTLVNAGVYQPDVMDFMTDGKDVSFNSGRWQFERENILLDELFGKKKYIHRKVTCYEKSDIFG